MSKVHFLIGHTSTEALNTDQTALVILPETISPAAVPTYSGQLYEGVKVLLKLGSEKNIFTTHFLPYLGAVDKNALAAKKSDLHAGYLVCLFLKAACLETRFSLSAFFLALRLEATVFLTGSFS